MLEAAWMPPRPPVPQRWKLTGPDCKAMLEASGIVGLTGTTAKELKPYEEHELVKRLLAYRKAKGEERENLKAAVLEHAPEKSPAPALPWNFSSPEQVTEICYEILGFTPASTDEVQLLRYKGRHPFFGKMLEHRRLKKLTGTYGKEWFKKAYDPGTRRVYPGYRQIGTSTGRFASGERGRSPNAQNL